MVIMIAAKVELSTRTLKKFIFLNNKLGTGLTIQHLNVGLLVSTDFQSECV